MTALARRLGALTGWRRLAVAAALGALSVLALPPLFVTPVLLVSFTGLVWLIDGASVSPGGWRRVLAIGWWFGFGHFVGGLYWITNALLVDAAAHGWLAPFAVSGLSLYFAVYPALACWAASRFPAGASRVLALAVAWAVSEWLRGFVLTGFPWNLMATTLAFDTAALQGAAVVGAYGLSMVVVAIAAAPSTLAVGERRGGAMPSVAALATALVLFGAGYARVAWAPAPEGAATELSLRIVQGNIDQRLKWRRDLARGHYLTYLRLSQTPAGGPDADVVIWPETAIPFTFSGTQAQLQALARAVPPDGVLITGAVRSTPPGVKPRKFWNAVLAVTGRGVEATYDKHHLVPFGEYVPLRTILPLTKITQGRVDFSAGPGPRSLQIPGVPAVSPLVCYEAIFPGAVVAPGARAQWLLNLTNDAWFGASAGPHQHLAAARLRAVEEGLPLVRAANTGISAVIDPWGRVLARLPLGRQGAVQARLPLALEAAPPFSRFGNGAFAVVAFVVFVCALWLGRRSIARGDAR
ncbi:MAG: apolipoprotein N-acyltransferase [Alphaproteobacteria bacterium]|nr:apolipoprotein N-acyltransferase [Alphaproteobacteria bacterium]